MLRRLHVYKKVPQTVEHVQNDKTAIYIGSSNSGAYAEC